MNLNPNQQEIMDELFEEMAKVHKEIGESLIEIIDLKKELAQSSMEIDERFYQLLFSVLASAFTLYLPFNPKFKAITKTPHNLSILWSYVFGCGFWLGRMVSIDEGHVIKLTGITLLEAFGLSAEQSLNAFKRIEDIGAEPYSICVEKGIESMDKFMSNESAVIPIDTAIATYWSD